MEENYLPPHVQELGPVLREPVNVRLCWEDLVLVTGALGRSDPDTLVSEFNKSAEIWDKSRGGCWHLPTRTREVASKSGENIAGRVLTLYQQMMVPSVAPGRVSAATITARLKQGLGILCSIAGLNPPYTRDLPGTSLTARWRFSGAAASGISLQCFKYRVESGKSDSEAANPQKRGYLKKQAELHNEWCGWCLGLGTKFSGANIYRFTDRMKNGESHEIAARPMNMEVSEWKELLAQDPPSEAIVKFRQWREYYSQDIDPRRHPRFALFVKRREAGESIAEALRPIDMTLDEYRAQHAPK